MIDQFIAEIRGNWRLRALLAGAIAVLWVYAILNLREAAGARSQQYVGLEKQIARTRAQVAQTDWQKRLDSAKLLQVELEGRLWQNSTQGLAQAAFQDWLTQATIRATLGRPAVTMLALEDKGDAAPASQADGTASGTPTVQLWKVRAKVEFDLTPAGLLNLLKQIAVNPQQVVVESMNIRKEPVPRVDMLLVANFQRAAAK